MSNMPDYLDWRGDLSFTASSFNEVDALVFSWLAYYEFEKLEEDVVGRTLREIAALHEAKFGAIHKISVRAAPGTPMPSAIWMLRCAADTERFGGIAVSQFKSLNAFGTQFGAVSFDLPGLRVIAYRGTDNSIAGWREDFELSFDEEIPCQRLALDYLRDDAGGLPLMLCGHSKGGNMAIYAAVNTDKAQRDGITGIYNFDGPGFCYDMSDREGWREIAGRVVKIVPECSIIGMLLEDGTPYRVIDSKMRTFFQHNAMFWQILGTRFVDVEKRTSESRAIEEIQKRWIGAMPRETRRAFTDVVFKVIESTGVKEFQELDTNILITGRRVLSGISGLSHEQKKLAVRLLIRMAGAWKAYLTGGKEKVAEE